MINIYKNTLYVSGRQPQGEQVAVPCQARGVATDLRDSCSVLRAVRPDGVVGGFADPSAPSSPWSLEGGFPRRPFLFSKQPFARTPSPPRDSHLPQRSHQSQARSRPFAVPSSESPESPPVVPAAAVHAKPREHPVPLAPEALSVCPPARSPPALLHVPRASPTRPPHRAMNHGPRAQVAGRMQPGVRTGLDVKPEGDGDDGHARSSE